MRSSILLGLTMLNYDIAYHSAARSAIDTGSQHTAKKHKAKPDGRPAFKNRNKKGRP